MNSQIEKQRNTIHILSNISRSKGTQTIKFGQLMKYNMRNIFLKKLNLNISLDQQSKHGTIIRTVSWKSFTQVF